ncbi:MAG: hypothetical protein O7C63_07475, partial [Alphaproteobacteria bacterium]|nr:hypothetical protein [Alphaproteobacteria bacterium]
MKKTLFACTALCGAVFMAANAAAETPEFLESRSQGPASTEYVNQDQERLSPTFRETPLLNIKLAGVVRVDATLIDQDLRGTKPGGAIFDTRRDFSVLAGGTADNGVSYGFEIDVGTGRGKMFISNLYGRVDLGDAKSATEALSINGGDAMVGTGHFARAGNKLVNHGSLSGARVVTYRGQGGTIRYTSPSYSGFTVAGSYTEESDTDGIDGVPFGTTPGSEDIFSVAGQYTSTYGEYTSVLYAGCEWSNENSRVRRLGIGAGAGIGGDAIAEHDQELCSFGAKTSGANAGFAIGYG